MALQKQYQAKVYDQDGSTFIKSFTYDREGLGGLKNLPSFRSRINGGLGEMVLDLNVKFDDFDEGTSVNFMNVVDLWVTDKDNPRGRRIYRGFTSRYEPYIDGSGEGVRVTCLGIASLLAYSFYADADLTVAHSGQDPTVIFKAVVDHWNTVWAGSLISYDSSSVPATVGTNVTFTFTDQKHFDALKKSNELAGTGWWWNVDADGKANMKAKPGTATHTFTIGKDIVSLTCTKDSEKVVNDVYVRRTGGDETPYTDATSQTEFGTGSPATGKRSKIISDSSIQDVTTADQRGNKELNDFKDEKIRARVVVDTHYDLESIKVGDTCKIRNFRKASTFFSDNMQIAGLTYNGDTVTLELEEHSADLGLALSEFVG